jgi:hypothetical protein
VKEKAAVAEESTVQESSPDAVGSKDTPDKAATEDVEQKHQLTKVHRVSRLPVKFLLDGRSFISHFFKSSQVKLVAGLALFEAPFFSVSFVFAFRWRFLHFC